jgi:hypothetical protein
MKVGSREKVWQMERRTQRRKGNQRGEKRRGRGEKKKVRGCG